jgi:Flp pilus assembly pilin Flp
MKFLTANRGVTSVEYGMITGMVGFVFFLAFAGVVGYFSLVFETLLLSLM